ncbi:MAG: hypothetical protein ACK4UJ_05010 [Leptonema sp. (in: bacteria)]
MFIFFNSYVYPNNEIGILISYNQLQPNRYFSSFENTFYNYYQLQKLFIFDHSTKNDSNQYEFYFIKHSIANADDFIKISFGTSKFPKVGSLYYSDNNQISSKWNGNFQYLILQYGKKFPLKGFFRKNQIEIWGGLGYIFNLEFNLTKTEYSQHFLSEPFSYQKGKFFSKEGYHLRIGFDLFNHYKINSFRIGIFFQYILSNLSDGKLNNEPTKLFLFNQTKAWISTDITSYIKNKENYESQNLNILYQYPKIESFRFIYGTMSIYFTIGIYF